MGSERVLGSRVVRLSQKCRFEGQVCLSAAAAGERSGAGSLGSLSGAVPLMFRVGKLASEFNFKSRIISGL